MLKEAEELYEWASVDQAANSDELVNYLDMATANDAVQRYKRQSYAIMKVAAGQRLLDVGCGTGDDVLALAEIVGPTGQVFGVDNSAVMIAEAEAKAARHNMPVAFRVTDGQRLQFADNSFDGCRADRVFQHLADREQVLSEMIRVVRPGGRVVAIDPDYETLIFQPSDKQLTRRIVHSCSDSARNGSSGAELYRLFKVAGLANVQVVPFGFLLARFDDANQIIGIDSGLERMQLSGELSAAEATQWRAGLIEADEAGTFFASLLGYTVCGEKVG